MQILITVALLALVIGVVFLFGSRQRGAGTSTKGVRPRPTAAGTRRKPVKPSSFQQAPAWLRRLPILLLIGAVVALGVALAQFRVSRTAKPPTVALVLDVSQSMNATDVEPSRLAAAQQAAETLVAQLPESFLVGLVSFADKATVLVPPTVDHAKVGAALDDPRQGRGTVIGDGLSATLDMIQQHWADQGSSPAVAVLLSDGRDTGSEVEPVDAAARAASIGVPVYTVVLGKTTGPGAADDVLLSQIASATGATTSTAGSAEALTTIYEDLGTELSTQLQISSSAQLFVIIAVLLAMAAAVVVIILSQRRPY
jgi:Ca-activated chloride channel family protein